MGNLKAIAVLLMVVLVCQRFSAAAQKPEESKATIKAQLDRIPIGKAIEVTLLREDSSRIKGKLMSVIDESFEVQTVQSGKISTADIAFSDVESVKKSGMRQLYKVLIIVAVVFVGLAIAIEASGFGD